jgi:hypothetical protein
MIDDYLSEAESPKPRSGLVRLDDVRRRIERRAGHVPARPTPDIREQVTKAAESLLADGLPHELVRVSVTRYAGAAGSGRHPSYVVAPDEAEAFVADLCDRDVKIEATEVELGTAQAAV